MKSYSVSNQLDRFVLCFQVDSKLCPEPCATELSEAGNPDSGEFTGLHESYLQTANLHASSASAEGFNTTEVTLISMLMWGGKQTLAVSLNPLRHVVTGEPVALD